MSDDESPTRRGFFRTGALALAGLLVGRRSLTAGEAAGQAAALLGPDDEPTEAVKAVLKQRFGSRRLQRVTCSSTCPRSLPTDAPCRCSWKPISRSPTATS